MADQAGGVYVHVPYCARACPYCDFDFAVGRVVDVQGYLAGLAAEVAARRLAGLAARTVYVGGGTPSLLGAAGLSRLLAQLRAWFSLDGSAEVTVELNPEHVDAGLLDALRAGGCTRVSIGAQTLDATGLVQLGRAHDAAAALAATRAAVSRGLSVSADLIVGWPGQSLAALDRDLAAFEEAGARHLSVYALTIESGTPWEALVRRGKRRLPDDDAQATLLARAAAWAHNRGWEHYEIASYAAGPDVRSRHNLGYWTGRDYVGLGPSAASARFAGSGAVQRRTNRRGVAAWLADPAGAEVETLDPVQAAAEGLWLGLRVLTGLSVSAYLRRFTAVDRAWLDARIAGPLGRGELAWASEDCLQIAPDRWLMHDAVAAAVL